MIKKYYYFMNFKMYLSYADMLLFAKQHKEEFITLTKNKNTDIVLLPSDLNLATIASMFNDTGITWGGQNCALEEDGAYTGQTSAQSLAELEASYCLVGHSEVRKETKRTDADFAHQVGTLLDLMISPLLCLGESKEEMETHKTIARLQAQITPLFTMLKKNPELGKEVPLFFAYEPLWSIGTGIKANNDHLIKTFQWLNEELSKNLKGYDYKLIYGGSVNAQNNKELKSIPLLDGFLIGKASLDFQEFKKIVD